MRHLGYFVSSVVLISSSLSLLSGCGANSAGATFVTSGSGGGSGGTSGGNVRWHFWRHFWWYFGRYLRWHGWFRGIRWRVRRFRRIGSNHHQSWDHRL